MTDADETAEITSRGRVIARLIPLSPAELAFREMVERGEIIPAKNPDGLAGWKPLPAREDGPAPDGSPPSWPGPSWPGPFEGSTTTTTTTTAS
jgi:antitoxin (DNA-binding transcriptional repressor) of toxin-antitoxin stability system